MFGFSLSTDEVLKAYDQHLNMVLGDVEETITTREIDEETFEELIKVNPRQKVEIFNPIN